MKSTVFSTVLAVFGSALCFGSVASSYPEGHRLSVRTSEVQLLPYPRIGKRFFLTEPVVRRAYSEQLAAPNWRSSRSMKDALMDIYDMTESKRSAPFIAEEESPLSSRLVLKRVIPQARFGKRAVSKARFG